ncbi:inorganic triphosphatase [Marinospirillum perlucidum]|uniref:CYTH domain-containing protein n=1 Tax=Marinospirillum perlucidum TaxID=1982602 RepID=UPI000DF2D99A|nr:CYTH domain-containing protein [Marinospirillum perlucidum]
MAEEIELKLLMQPQDLPRLDALMQQLEVTGPQVNRLENTYYDTPELHLNQAKAALRLRHTGKGWVQTLKTSGQSRGALSQRGEWEANIDQPRLHPELLPEGILQADWLDKLQPIFTTHFTRKTWLQEKTSGQGLTCIEVAADSGEVALPSGQSDRISELELELKSGKPEALFTLAERLAESICLHPGLASKAERGLRLLDPERPAFRLAQDSLQQADMKALNQLAENQLNRWIQGHENWTFNAKEAEIHAAQRALLALQGLLVIMQRLCPEAPLHQARIDVKKLLALLQPWVKQSHADRVLQQLYLEEAPSANWRQQQLGYATRRQEYRSLWQQLWVGQASLQLVSSLYACHSFSDSFHSEQPQRLLQAACAHLRLPRQPMEAEIWLQRYPAVVRLEYLLRVLPTAAEADRQLARDLVKGIEDLQGYSYWLVQKELPSEVQQQLTDKRKELLFNLGRWAQALWTSDQ